MKKRMIEAWANETRISMGDKFNHINIPYCSKTKRMFCEKIKQCHDLKPQCIADEFHLLGRKYPTYGSDNLNATSYKKIENILSKKFKDCKQRIITICDKE